MSLTIVALKPGDRIEWERLARGYKDFYKTPTSDAEYDDVWHRLLAQEDIQGLAAFLDGQLVGIAHYFFHTAVWAKGNCYLQDLFTAPPARGKGVARALIEAVATQAREVGATRYYWLTQSHNVVARGLYDQIAKHKGFIRYDYPLQ